MSEKENIQPRLNILERYRFSGLVPKGQRDLFLGRSEPEAEYLRAGISLEDQPAGVALVRLAGKNDSAFLTHFYIRSDHRRRGLGQRLFSVLEEELRNKGQEKIKVQYRDKTEFGARFGKFLEAMGFSAPELNRIELEISSPRLKKVRWFKKFACPGELEVFPWRKTTEADRKKLEARSWLPEKLNPFKTEEFDEEISCGLRRGGEIIGWLLIREEEPGQYVVPTGYVSGEDRGRFLIGLLIWPVLRDAIEKGMKKLSFTIPTDFTDHIEFHETHTKPHAEKFYYLHSRQKKLLNKS